MLNNLKVVFTVSDHRRAPSHCFLALKTLHCIGMYGFILSLKIALCFSLPRFPTNPLSPNSSFLHLLILISLIPTPYTSSFAFFFPYSPLTSFFLPGPGEQGPEQRKDLSDLSDSESGQDGPERDEQQEVHSGPETAVWGGRYLKSSQYNFIVVEGAAVWPIQVVKQCAKY